MLDPSTGLPLKGEHTEIMDANDAWLIGFSNRRRQSLLTTPKKFETIDISFATKATHVDVRRLKYSMWEQIKAVSVGE